MALPFKHALSAPITTEQFFKSFREAWTNILPRYQRAPVNHIPRRIGIFFLPHREVSFLQEIVC
jgi:WD repeat-containing protein 48